jgi:hypothetical protein
MDRVNDVKSCFGDGTSNTDSIVYSVQTGGTGGGSGRVDPVPVGWYGEFVRIISIGADSRYYFTKLSTAQIDPAIAATATGAQSPKKGELLAAGIEKQVLIPTAGPGETVFLARASAGAPTGLELTKASGKPGNNTGRDG